MDNLEKEVNLDKIIDKMYEKFGEDGLSEIEQARYLYIELGNLLRYDLNYESVYDIKQDDAYYKSVDFDNVQTNSYVCIQLNQLYAELLRRVDIDAEAIKSWRSIPDDETPHVYTVVNLRDGREFIADLTFDLGYIQNGLKTNDFGTRADADCDVISEEELLEIDKNIGYAVPVQDADAKYMETFLQMLREELDDEEKMRNYLEKAYPDEKNIQYDPEKLIKYKFDFIGRCFFLEKMGYVEAKRFLKTLYDKFFSIEEKKQIQIGFLHSEKDNENKVIDTTKMICYCWKKSETDSDYYLYEQGQKFRQISKDELVQKLSEKQYQDWGHQIGKAVKDVDDIFY